MPNMPDYANLPIRQGAPLGSSWGIWGSDDDVGAINLLTPDRVLEAVRLVRQGTVFSLNWGLHLPDPPILGRRPLRHTVFDGPSGTDDKYDDFFPQASSQWDALSHVCHPQHGFYNGWRRDQITGRPGSRLGIEAWAERGIVGRFLLLDLARSQAAAGAPIDPSVSAKFGVEDLEKTLDHQGAQLLPGSILLLRFGWIEWYMTLDAAAKARLAAVDDLGDPAADLENFFPAPGLDADERVAEWLWNHQVAAVAADCPAVEAMPLSRLSPDTFLHYRLVPLLGIALGEMWYLDALAADCASDGRWEGLLTSAPLNKLGGSGSPANALAIK